METHRQRVHSSANMMSLDFLGVNAFVYMTLGRLIYFFHPAQRCFGLKAQSIAKYFVIADIFSFLIQLVGGVMLNGELSPETIKRGLTIYMSGMGVQMFFMVSIPRLQYGICGATDTNKMGSFCSRC